MLDFHRRDSEVQTQEGEEEGEEEEVVLGLVGPFGISHSKARSRERGLTGVVQNWAWDPQTFHGFVPSREKKEEGWS